MWMAVGGMRVVRWGLVLVAVAVVGSEAAERGSEAGEVSRERRRGGCCGGAAVGLVARDAAQLVVISELFEMVAESRQNETEKEVKSCW